MKKSDVPVGSLEDGWKQFSKTWKRAKHHCGESEIHDLRVASRRFASVLALVDSVFNDIGADNLRRRFKKVLRQLGGLRDAQVQLLRAKDTQRSEVPKAFRESLETKVGGESRRVSSFLRGGGKAKLRKRLSKLEDLLQDRLIEMAPSKVHASLAREITARYSVFARARSRFVRAGEANLHVMRIALKNLRYGVEGAAPFLNIASRSEIRALQALQKKLGDMRDLQIFGTNLEEWAENQGGSAKQKTKVLCDRLQHQYISAVASLQSSSQLNGNLLPARLRKPARTAQRTVAKERTVAAVVAAKSAAAPQIFERVARIH